MKNLGNTIFTFSLAFRSPTLVLSDVVMVMFNRKQGSYVAIKCKQYLHCDSICPRYSVYVARKPHRF